MAVDGTDATYCAILLPASRGQVLPPFGSAGSGPLLWQGHLASLAPASQL